jgi:TetR/AcrR family transcriptional repressor of nem operon
MARQKAFKREEALDKALQVFWCMGFEATSMQDLVEAMGINRQSLYDTFGDKRTLFLAALDRYVEQQGTQLQQMLEQTPSAKEGLRRVFDSIVSAALQGDQRGCLLVNTAVELPVHDEQTARSLCAKLAQTEDLLRDTVRRAQAAGEISRKHSPETLARFLMNNIRGMQAMARSGDGPDGLRDVVDLVFAALE